MLGTFSWGKSGDVLSRARSDSAMHDMSDSTFSKWGKYNVSNACCSGATWLLA
jgi:hypothetical protein